MTTPKRPGNGARRVGWVYATALAIGFVGCGLSSLELGQDNNWDLLNYHYYNPHAFLNDRIGYDVAPAQRQSYLNPFLDLPFYWGTRRLPPRVLGFVMGGIHGLSFGLVFALCAIVFRRFASALRWALAGSCSLAGLYAPVFIGELGASQNDALVGLFVLTALVLFARALAARGTLSGRDSRHSVVAASLIFGVGAGLKATLMPHAVGIAIAVMFTERTWRARTTVLAIVLGSILVGFLLANGYWMVRMWQEFANPLYPFLNDVFRSPWADPRSYADRSMIPSSLLDAVVLPFRFLTHSDYTAYQNDFRDGRYALLCVVMVAWAVDRLVRVIVRRTKRTSRVEPMPTEVRFLVVFFVVSFVAWEASFSIIRYASTLELLAPLVIVALASACVRGGAIRTGAIAAATLAVVIATVKPIHYERVTWGERFWEVSVPDLPSPNAVVVIANARPWAYLIPPFPPEIRFVSVDNNLTRPSSKTRTQEEIRRLLAWFEGDVYLLSRDEPEFLLEHDVRVLGPYGLRLEDAAPLPIASKHSPPGVHLWRLRRF